MAGGNWKRRTRVVINKPLQRRIVMSVSWPMAVTLLSVIAIQIGFVLRLKRELLSVGTELTGIAPLFRLSVVFFVFAMIFQILHALKVSHWVAGSAFAIGKTLRMFRKGDRKSRVRLRRGYLLSELTDDINSFLDWVEEKPASSGHSRTAAPAAEATGKTDPVPSSPR